MSTTAHQAKPRGKRVLPKSPKSTRRVLDLHKMVKRVADRYGVKAATEWTKATLKHQREINETQLRSAIVSRNMNAIEAAVAPTKLQQQLAKATTAALSGTIQVVGRGSQKALAAYGIEAKFNASHPNVVQFARQRSAELVAGVPKQTKQVIAEVIARGAQHGLSVVDQARAIREVVGLPPHWASAPTALEAELRSGRIASATSRRMSAALKQQIRSQAAKGPISDAFIKKAVGEYSASLVNARALTIARTESHRAANYGLTESWDQAMSQGVLPPNSRRFWIVTPDDRLCAICVRIPGMNKDGRGLSESFMTPEGLVDQPPAPHPNCRCAVGLGFGVGTAAQPAPGQVGARIAERSRASEPVQRQSVRKSAVVQPPPEVHAEVRQVLQDLSVEREAVVYSTTLGSNATMGGDIVGVYARGKITIDPRRPIAMIKQTVAHEATHLKFDMALRVDKKLKKDIMKDYAGLKADDGVTPYSTKHWDLVAQQERLYTAGYTPIIPIEETLAEMRAIQAAGRTVGSPRYQALMKRIDEGYAKWVETKGAVPVPRLPASPKKLRVVAVDLEVDQAYAAELRSDMVSRIQKRSRPGGLISGSAAETDLAYRSNDPLTFAMAKHIEQVAGREVMLEVLESGVEWNTGWVVAAREWEAAQALGANVTSSSTTKSAIKAAHKLRGKMTPELVEGFRARQEFVKAWVKREYPDGVTVYRGIKRKQAAEVLASGAEEVDLGTYGLSSWTTLSSKAMDFAGKKGVVLRATLTPEDVWWANDLGTKGIIRYSDDHGEIVLKSKAAHRRAQVIKYAR